MEDISKYLEDKQFIRWVFSDSNELDEWWTDFEARNPDEKQNIQLARNILQKLHTRDTELSEDDKIILFTRILKQVEKRQQFWKIRRLYFNIASYAAVAILFFAIGALFFYRKDNFNPDFLNQDVTEPAYTDARIVRPDGEDILLHEKKSHIEYRQDGQVVVNNQVIKTAGTDNKKPPQMNQLVIPYGKTSELILPDGTKVWLNAGSRLIYPDYFADKNREVLLFGEAFFEVSHNEKQPFIVQTSDIRIKVMGTQFNVSAYPTDHVIETVLTQGKVRLEQNSAGMFSETLDINPGQLAVYSKTEQTTLISEIDTENYILWKEGLLKFESTDLSRLVKKLERYFNVRFNYSDPMLGTIRISGKLELSDSCESVLNNVADAASIRITQSGENFYKISH
jgi:transmembrane sensor